MINSLNRPVNLFLAGYSFLRSGITGSPVVRGMPVALGIELTNNCNLHCPQCASGSGQMERGRGFMDTGLFKKIIAELDPYLYNLNLYFQGEPMLHPKFFVMLNECRNFHTVVSTNGHFLNPENSDRIARSPLRKLIVSVDGLDQETYSITRRGGDLQTVIDGIRNVSVARKKNRSRLKIEIQFLVNKNNENQMSGMKRLAREMSASLKLKSMQISEKKEISLWLPADKKFARYKLRDGDYIAKNSLPERCPRAWFNPVVTWDGKILPCCFDKNGEFIMGDLTSDSLAELWDGPKFRIFRKSILTGRHSIEICRNCTSGLKGVRY